MRNLQERGDFHFKEGRYSPAIWNYDSALTICKVHEFKESAARLYSKAAAVYLKCDDFGAASRQAQMCIALDPEFAKVSTTFAS